MKFSTNNFLMAVKNLVTGDAVHNSGFLKDISLTPQSIATTGTRATAENTVPADAIVIDADGEDAIVNFTVPRDYDESSDHLKVFLLVAYVSGTSITLQADSVSKGSPTEIYADLSAFVPATATTINAAFSIGEVEADLSNLTHERHDSLAVNFVAADADTTPVVHIVGARIEYKSTLVSHDKETTSRAFDLR